MRGKLKAITFALLAAALYALNTPLSKTLLNEIEPTFMAAFLYLGAGVGVGVMYLFNFKNEPKTSRLGKKDLIYTLGMIILDILAPIFLMFGLKTATASNAALLGNFEIVATALIALFLFKEPVSKCLWSAIFLITLASIGLSFEGGESLKLSTGSLFVLLAAFCWGLENNCTGSISDKSTYQIVVLKGFFSGGGSALIAFLLGESFPDLKYVFLTMLLGFFAYGLSIFFYIRAQHDLGAAKTSAYYAAAPFIGALLSFLILGERLSALYFVAFSLMLAGTAFVVLDTLAKKHIHSHTHIVIKRENGIARTYQVTHSHPHSHYIKNRHRHYHNPKLLLKEIKTAR